LTPANDETLKFLNINSYNTWFDPYTIIINEFMKKYSKDLKPIPLVDYFSRNKLKKTIMTKFYNATYKTLLSEYLSQFTEDILTTATLKDLIFNFKIF